MLSAVHPIYSFVFDLFLFFLVFCCCWWCCCCIVVTVIADDFIESLSMIHQFQWVYIRWWINDETIFKTPKWLVLIDSYNSKRKRWKLNTNERVPSGKINSFQCYLLNTNLISIGNGNRKKLFIDAYCYNENEKLWKEFNTKKLIF